MTNFRNALTLSLGLLIGGTAVAQNHITIGVTPGQTTSGTSSNGGAGGIGVTIGGYGNTPVNVPAGTDSAGIATAAAAALTAQGFAVTQNGTEITVTSGPGGAPLMHGGGIGSTDTGITGVRAKVEKAPGPALPVPQAQKNNGGNVRKANPQKQAQGPGHIQVDVEVLRFLNGQWVLLWIQVVVQVMPGDDGQTINNRVRQQLRAQGMIVNDITLPPSVAPITPMPQGCFGMDRTDDGGKVQGVLVDWFGGAKDLLDVSEAGAGQTPDAGATEYDRSIDQNGQESEDFMVFQGDATPGQGGVFDAFVAPNQFSIWVIGNGPGGQLQAPLVPLPMIGFGFDLPVDPFGALLIGGISDPLGTMHLPLPIPPNPMLAGFELQLTAMTLDPFAPTLFDGARRTNGVTVRIGN